MEERTTEHNGLTRRQLFRTAGAAALGGMTLALGPRLGSMAHEEGEAVDLKIHMGEMYFQVHEIDGEEVEAEKNAPIRLEAGKPHLIRFENEGAVEHEAHFGLEPDLENRRYKKNLFSPDGNSPEGVLGIHLRPGESATFHLWIPEERKGEWEMGCFMPGHYEAGQHAPFIVE